MDAIFGKQNFRNEIVWCYAGGGIPKYDYPRKHDIILRYSLSKEVKFNVEYQDYGPHNTTGRRFTDRDGTRSIAYREEGTPINDWWADISPVINLSNERMGYPTQKPLRLYERIVKASSNPDDLVLDPFAGCGTTIEAALKHDRRVIGIDILPFALHLINKYRVAPYAPKLQNPDKLLPMKGVPVDYDTASALVDSDPFKFQDWAVSLVHGFASNPKKVGDDGIDGYGALLNKPDNMDRQGILVQVTGAKGSQKGKYDRLHANVRNENAAMGVLITLDAQPASRNWDTYIRPNCNG